MLPHSNILPSLKEVQPDLIKLETQLFHRMDFSVIIIQSAWRSYHCSVNYLLSLGGVVFFQAIVRQHIHKNKCNMMRILKMHFYAPIGTL